MSHMCVLMYLKKIKYYLSVEKMFVWAKWEGSTHDTHIFFPNAINNPNVKFPKTWEKLNVILTTIMVNLYLWNY